MWLPAPHYQPIYDLEKHYFIRDWEVKRIFKNIVCWGFRTQAHLITTNSRSSQTSDTHRMLHEHLGMNDRAPTSSPGWRWLTHLYHPVLWLDSASDLPHRNVFDRLSDSCCDLHLRALSGIPGCHAARGDPSMRLINGCIDIDHDTCVCLSPVLLTIRAFSLCQGWQTHQKAEWSSSYSLSFNQ